MRTIKLLLVTGLLLTIGTTLRGQVSADRNEIYLPKFALKTNALMLASSTFNLGFEVGLAKKLTLDVSANYNPWEFKYFQLKHWLVEPELRYWLCERFRGSFFGLHAYYGEMDVHNLKAFGMGHYYYKGNSIGVGLSYGYQWMISKRWSMEATVGFGYSRMKYDKYDGSKEWFDKDTYHFFAPTKMGLSFIYMIK